MTPENAAETHELVDHVNLVVHRGEIFGFPGPNGARKSTTIRSTLCGLLQPTSAEAIVGGPDVATDSDRIAPSLEHIFVDLFRKSHMSLEHQARGRGKTMTTGNSVETRELVKRFGAFVAVDDVNLVVRRGEIVGFPGPNGAWKSTTIRMRRGLLQPTSAEEIVGDSDRIALSIDLVRKSDISPERQRGGEARP